MFADASCTRTKMVLTEDGGHILAIYGELLEVFSKARAETFPPCRSPNHAIDLKPTYTLPYGGIYNLSEFKLRMLKDYIEANIADGFILQSSSPAAAPINFAKMIDGG